MSEKKTFIVFPPVDYEHGVVAVKQKSKRAKKRAAQRKNKQIRQKSETEADCEQKIEVRTKLKSKKVKSQYKSALSHYKKQHNQLRQYPKAYKISK